MARGRTEAASELLIRSHEDHQVVRDGQEVIRHGVFESVTRSEGAVEAEGNRRIGREHQGAVAVVETGGLANCVRVVVRGTRIHAARCLARAVVNVGSGIVVASCDIHAALGGGDAGGAARLVYPHARNVQAARLIVLHHVL